MTVPTLPNGDGEEVVFHRVRFPFASGATHALIADRRPTRHSAGHEARNLPFLELAWRKTDVDPEGRWRMAWGVTMLDGTSVLGNIELKGRALILAVTSAERARRGSAIVANALGKLVSTPLTTIETVEQATAVRREGLTACKPSPAVALEVATPLVHAVLDPQYRAILDDPVGMLGDITPRAAAKAAAGRDRLSS